MKSYKALNCGIPGDRTQHIWEKAEDLSVPAFVKYVAIHCGTNKLQHDKAKATANAIIQIGKVFQEKLTNFLP